VSFTRDWISSSVIRWMIDSQFRLSRSDALVKYLGLKGAPIPVGPHEGSSEDMLQRKLPVKLLPSLR
jgi:hypothetical protein